MNPHAYLFKFPSKQLLIYAEIEIAEFTSKYDGNVGRPTYKGCIELGMKYSCRISGRFIDLLFPALSTIRPHLYLYE